jgi:hypothetical protein
MLGLLLLVVLVALVVVWWPKGKERYGGPVKNITHIPFNNCERICSSYYDRCMNVYGDMDAGVCSNTFNSCVGECYYSSAHRL